MSNDRYDDSEKGYEVGYGKPPAKTQFKKGQSGNPKGRPKKSTYTEMDFIESLAQELNSPISIREDGCAKTMPKHQVIAKRLIRECMDGKLSAIKFAMEKVEKAFPHDEAAPVKILPVPISVKNDTENGFKTPD